MTSLITTTLLPGLIKIGNDVDSKGALLIVIATVLYILIPALCYMISH
jgi:hypothetical protein